MATTADGAAHLIAKVASRIRPVSLNATLTEKSRGNFAMRGPGKKSIQRLQHRPQTPRAGLGRKVAGFQTYARDQIVQASKRIEVQA